MDLCISNIDKYPEEDIDYEIFCLTLKLISQAVLKSPIIQ